MRRFLPTLNTIDILCLAYSNKTIILNSIFSTKISMNYILYIYIYIDVYKKNAELIRKVIVFANNYGC